MDADEKGRRMPSVAAADAYAAHSPGYPSEAVSWLVGTAPARILELGAGTGRLTSVLTSLGHHVVATDPSAEMLQHVRTEAPSAHCTLARAEDIPLPSSSVDVVVAGQAFHWFDAERALPEIARVLRPGGTLSLVWTTGDIKVPWVRKVFALSRTEVQPMPEDPYASHDVFTLAERRLFRHWQIFRKPDVLSFIETKAGVATLSAKERGEVLEDAGALYDSYGRGPDGLQMPWLTYCYRGRVSGLNAQASNSIPVPREDPDDGLFIDFN